MGRLTISTNSALDPDVHCTKCTVRIHQREIYVDNNALWWKDLATRAVWEYQACIQMIAKQNLVFMLFLGTYSKSLKNVRTSKNFKILSLTLSIYKTLPKAQRTRGLSSSYQSNFFRSYHKFLQKSWSNLIFKISTKNQLQYRNQTSASRLNLKFKILTKT